MHKILIVDDDLQILELVVKILNSKDYKSIVATNGKKAIEVAKQTNPDLILMDWMMPEMNGIDAIKHLKQDQKTQDIPIIMLTSQSGTEFLVKGFEAGAIDYIKKPIDIPELLIRVESAIKLIESYKEISKLKIKQLENEAEISRMKNLELKSEIEAQSQKLYLTGIHLTEKSDLITKIFDELKKFSKTYDDLNLDDVFDKINQATQMDHDLNHFKENLDKLNLVLTKLLKDKHPDLSDNELKICSMVHLGLSNKEIASLLFISERTAESHRYRITKKLNLKTGRDLRKFLLKMAK